MAQGFETVVGVGWQGQALLQVGGSVPWSQDFSKSEGLFGLLLLRCQIGGLYSDKKGLFLVVSFKSFGPPSI